jgi:protein-S-isoprenylcysteine O-methyltransferase Ste14
MNTFTAHFVAYQARILLVYFILFFALGFVWSSWRTYSSTGRNPLVLPRNDSPEGYIGRAFKIVLVLLGVHLSLQTQFTTTSNAMLSGLHVPLWQSPVWLQIAAWSGLTLSLGLMAFAQHQMGSSWRIGIDTQQPGALVSSSVFRVSRNPIFLSMRISLLCLVILQPTAPILALVIAGELLLQIQVRLEEAFLSSHYGASYRSYTQAVRRWL